MDSSPSVSAIGDVVRVSRELDVTRKINLSAIKLANSMPCLVILNIQNLNTTSPGVAIIFMKKVKSIINLRDFIPFKSNLAGIFEFLITRISTRASGIYMYKSLTINIETKKIVSPYILTLGSSL